MRALAVSVLLLLAGPAPPALAGVDLRTIGPLGLAGSDSADLAVVGDVNGDGRADLATSLASDLTNPEFDHTDRAAVVAFGGGPPDPTRPGFTGWVVTHAGDPRGEDGSYAFGGGGEIAGVGDWNGDGLDDVAFGADGAGGEQRESAGAVYIVLGRPDSGRIDLRTAAGVIRIDGPVRGGGVGTILASAGDVDGDGRPDLAIALHGEAAVIVRGGFAGTRLDLAKPPPGTTIPVRGLDGGESRFTDREGPAGSEVAVFAPVGDVDGDGHGELLAGVPAQDPLRGRGRVFVLRGVAAGGAIDARAALARVVGPELQPGFGGSLAAAGDSDGDGRPEWLIGAALPRTVIAFGDDDKPLPGGAHMVFSRARGEVRPGRAGQPALTVEARGLGMNAGRGVAGVPDQTEDGVPDLLIGLPDASPGCRAAAGAIALVPGARVPGTVKVTRTSPRVDGPYVGAKLGAAIAGGAGELFLGTVSFERSARLDLWRVGLDPFRSASPPLPTDCLKVTVRRRTRAQLLRDGVVRVTVRSDVGDNRVHRVKLGLFVGNDRREIEVAPRTLRVTARVARRLTFTLPRRALTILRVSQAAGLYVLAEQTVGTGNRVTRGAFGGDGLTFRR
jgi:hypothetical protein